MYTTNVTIYLCPSMHNFILQTSMQNYIYDTWVNKIIFIEAMLASLTFHIASYGLSFFMENSRKHAIVFITVIIIQ